MDLLRPLHHPRYLQPLRSLLDGGSLRNSGTARPLIADTCQKQGIVAGDPTINADRGTSMTSKPAALLMADPGSPEVTKRAATGPIKWGLDLSEAHCALSDLWSTLCLNEVCFPTDSDDCHHGHPLGTC